MGKPFNVCKTLVELESSPLRYSNIVGGSSLPLIISARLLAAAGTEEVSMIKPRTLRLCSNSAYVIMVVHMRCMLKRYGPQVMFKPNEYFDHNNSSDIKKWNFVNIRAQPCEYDAICESNPFDAWNGTCRKPQKNCVKKRRQMPVTRMKNCP